MSEHPPLDPAKLLAHWMEWERGGLAPGELVKNLKRAGMRELLEEMAAAGSPTDTATA
jgi:hypothetical protein